MSGGLLGRIVKIRCEGKLGVGQSKPLKLDFVLRDVDGFVSHVSIMFSFYLRLIECIGLGQVASIKSQLINKHSSFGEILSHKLR